MTGRPSLWLCSPAWQRYDVTRLALAQRAHLIGELAGRGIDAHCVIVADDANLDIAREYGFDTVEQDNTQIGRKFNDGLEYACRQGADFVTVVGSDNWVHPDMFQILPEPELELPEPGRGEAVVVSVGGSEVVTGREIALVDLATARLRRCQVKGIYGVIPWVMPARLLEPCGYRPVAETQMRGLDGSLVCGLKNQPVWVFHDPHPYARVDFKSDVNLNTYEAITGAIGYGDTLDPWQTLTEHYPAALVEMARETAALVA